MIQSVSPSPRHFYHETIKQGMQRNNCKVDSRVIKRANLHVQIDKVWVPNAEWRPNNPSANPIRSAPKQGVEAAGGKTTWSEREQDTEFRIAKGSMGVELWILKTGCGSIEGSISRIYYYFQSSSLEEEKSGEPTDRVILSVSHCTKPSRTREQTETSNSLAMNKNVCTEMFRVRDGTKSHLYRQTQTTFASTHTHH